MGFHGTCTTRGTHNGAQLVHQKSLNMQCACISLFVDLAFKNSCREG